jgi:cyclophilin family peptidyl-prolyl cis-trans isomerase/HEAT repeat protein
MKPSVNIFIGFLIFITITSCSKKVNRFSDKELQKLFTHQYNRETQKLYPYFTHSNPLYRKEAALSFSSIGDTNAIASLSPLLKDKDAEVRKAASFALGQLKNVKAMDALVNQSKLEKDSRVHEVMLEAIGRCANLSGLKYLIDFTPKDTLEEAGQAWGIYRAANRGTLSEEGTLKQSKNLGLDKTFEVSLASAYYFYRGKSTIDAYLDDIMKLAEQSKYVEVRMAAIRSLRKSKDDRAAELLLKILSTAKDYRLRVDAINTLRAFDYETCKAKVLDALRNDEKISVRVAAAEYFEAKKSVEDRDLYLAEASKTNNSRIKTLLLQAAMGIGIDNSKISTMLKDQYANTNDVCQKQVLLDALAESHENLDFILEAFKKESYGEVLATFTGTLALMKMNHLHLKEEEKKVATFFVDLLASKNKYLVMQGLTGIMDSIFQVKKYYPSPTYIQEAKKKAAPIFKPNESSYKLFDLALDYYASSGGEAKIKEFEKKAFDLTAYSTPGFKPVDWKTISAIPHDAKVLVKTDKGNFVIQLLVDETPFTVNAFYDGVKQKLFDGLQWYRVVPNFVNQTGGTMDVKKDSLANLRIRSEYNMTKHREGTVNLASNGRDTETSHFSIMLCPTPWNDNNYTLFGKVIEGLDVVHKIELSDYILSMSIVE